MPDQTLLSKRIDHIPAIDNHCHPILRDQNLDRTAWRRCFSEAHDPVVAERDVLHTLYYRWAVRQIAAWHGSDPTEDAMLLTRQHIPLPEYTRQLAETAGIECLVVDEGFPSGPGAFTADEMAHLFGVRVVRILRLETLLQRLIVETDTFEVAELAFRRHVIEARNSGYVGLKSIAAYRSGLAVGPVTRGEALVAFENVHADAIRRRQLRLTNKQVIDYFLGLALAIANEQQLPVQFHTGYGDPDLDLSLANPLLLRGVIERYPRAPIVLLHESYPYTREAAFLATVYPNVHVDVSTVIPFLDRGEIMQSFRHALGVAPSTRILFSSDATNIPELHWLGPTRARPILTEIFTDMIAHDEIDLETATTFARNILHDNAARLYRLDT